MRSSLLDSDWLCRMKFVETKKRMPNAKQRGKLIEHFSNSLHSHTGLSMFLKILVSLLLGISSVRLRFVFYFAAFFFLPNISFAKSKIAQCCAMRPRQHCWNNEAEVIFSDKSHCLGSWRYLSNSPFWSTFSERADFDDSFDDWKARMMLRTVAYRRIHLKRYDDQAIIISPFFTFYFGYKLGLSFISISFYCMFSSRMWIHSDWGFERDWLRFDQFWMDLNYGDSYFIQHKNRISLKSLRFPVFAHSNCRIVLASTA